MPEGATPRERNIMPKVGPRFFRDGPDVTFEFVVDPNSIIGPRLATEADSEKHPEAWHEFVSGVADEVFEVVPDAREPEPAAEPETRVDPKEMDDFEARLQPAAQPPKRKYVRRKAV